MERIYINDKIEKTFAFFAELWYNDYNRRIMRTLSHHMIGQGEGYGGFTYMLDVITPEILNILEQYGIK